MDPNANLAEQRTLVAELIVRGDVLSPDEIAEKANRLAELAAALDEWLTRGGFLPADWQQPR